MAQNRKRLLHNRTVAEREIEEHLDLKKLDHVDSCVQTHNF